MKKKFLIATIAFGVAAVFAYPVSMGIFAGIGMVKEALAQQTGCFKAQGGNAFSAGSGCIFDGGGQVDVFVLDADNDTTISAPTDDQIDIEIAGADDFTFTANDFDVLSGSTLSLAGTAISSSAAELNSYGLTTCIADVSTAQSDWVIAPHAGDITSIWTVIDGALADVDAIITLELANTLVTGSSTTIAFSGSAAGDIDTGTGSAANTVAAGGAIEVITNGGSTNTVEVCVTMLIER